jgi:hypothetical protein
MLMMIRWVVLSRLLQVLLEPVLPHVVASKPTSTFGLGSSHLIDWLIELYQCAFEVRCSNIPDCHICSCYSYQQSLHWYYVIGVDQWFYLSIGGEPHHLLLLLLSSIHPTDMIHSLHHYQSSIMSQVHV